MSSWDRAVEPCDGDRAHRDLRRGELHFRRVPKLHRAAARKVRRLLARLLALVHTALADAGVAIWESKYHYRFWRPVTAVREADEGTGPSGLATEIRQRTADPAQLLRHRQRGVHDDGTTICRKVWDGRGNFLELAVEGPAGRIDGLSLRLYNAESHQWSLNFASARSGTLSPPTIGEFRNGRGEFFSQETRHYQ